MSLSLWKKMYRWPALLLALAVLARPSGAADLNLRIPGIPGESITAQHQGDISLKSVSFSFSNPAHTGNITNCVVQVVKLLDKSTPQLLALTANGTITPLMTIYQTRTDGVATNLVQITLHNVIVSNHDSHYADGHSSLTEQLDLNAAYINWSYAVLQ